MIIAPCGCNNINDNNKNIMKNGFELDDYRKYVKLIVSLDFPLDNKEVRDFLYQNKLLFHKGVLELKYKDLLDEACRKNNLKWREGRPNKGDNKRKKRGLYLTDDEYDDIKKDYNIFIKSLKGNKKIFTLSEYIRNILLYKKPVEDKYINAKLVSEINKIGNNINQMAKKLNSYNSNYTSNLSFKLEKDFSKIEQELIKLKELSKK